MTLDEFRATGCDCDDLGAALSDGYWEEYSEPAHGRLYLGHLWIQRKPAAGWPQGCPENWFYCWGTNTGYRTICPGWKRCSTNSR